MLRNSQMVVTVFVWVGYGKHTEGLQGGYRWVAVLYELVTGRSAVKVSYRGSPIIFSTLILPTNKNIN